LVYNECFQNTIKSAISISGIGLFTGEKVKVTIHPANVDSGIIFKRVDLLDKPILKADLNLVKETDRQTLVGFGKKSIQTVEHLMSALAAYNVDNALIEIDGSEIPIYDGSSKAFANLLENNILAQEKKAEILKIENPIYFSENNTHLVALPSDEYKISFTLDHPNSDFIKSQYFSYIVDKKTYLKEIAPSRTFSIYEEIKPLLDNNLIKGGSLDNAVLIKDNKVVNDGGVRFANEMVRHKILDLMGDLKLLSKRVLAHIIAIRSGHLTNIKFAKKIDAHFKEGNN